MDQEIATLKLNINQLAGIVRVQSVIDDLRDQMAERVQDAEKEEGEPEED